MKSHWRPDPVAYKNKKAHCHSVNNFINDITILLLKISTTFNNGIKKFDMYLLIIFINLMKYNCILYIGYETTHTLSDA